MNYYDKYFRYYKGIMKPVIEWKKELEVKDNKKLWWCLWGGMLLIVVEIIGMILGNTFLGKIDARWCWIVSVVGASIMIVTVNRWERWLGEKVDEYKQKVANKHGKDNFIQLEEAKEREFKEKLNEEKISTKEQYRILIDAIDQQLKVYKPKKILNYGALGALLLPVWNTFIGKLFETEEMLLALGASGTIIIVVIYIFILGSKIKNIREEIYNLTHSNIYKLQGLKEILLELELMELGNR